MEDFVTPTILVSKCLGFEKCRYNGDIINDPVIKQLQNHAHFITVCPEVEIGLGVPRQPVRVVQDNGKLKLYQPATGEEFTDQMNNFIADYLNKIPHIDGIILKYRSPSCGLYNVKVYQGFDPDKAPVKGAGMFGQAIKDQFGDLALEDDGRLKNFAIREHFYTKLYTIAAFRKLSETPTMKGLVDFHSRNKLLFMAFNQTKMRILGKIVANPQHQAVEQVFAEYYETMLELLQQPSHFKSWINALTHAFGMISEGLSQDEKQFFLNLIEEYRDERIPVSVLINLIQSWALRFDNQYLLSQRLLQPFPKELTEITDSGKGRDR